MTYENNSPSKGISSVTQFPMNSTRNTITDETRKVLLSPTIKEIHDHFEKFPIEARLWCRDANAIREWLRTNAIPNSIQLSESNLLKELMISEHDTLFEVIMGKSQWFWRIDSKEQQSCKLLSQLDSLFDGPTQNYGPNNEVQNEKDTIQTSGRKNKKHEKRSIIKGKSNLSMSKEENTINFLKYLVENLQLSLNEIRYSSNGRTLLHYIVCCSDEKISMKMRLQCCKYLLGRGALPLCDTRDRENPVHSLCHIMLALSTPNSKLSADEQKAFIELLEILIDSRPETLHEVSTEGETPAHIICKGIPEKDDFLCFHRKILETMLEYNANLNKVNHSGKTCFDLLTCEQLKKEVEGKISTSSSVVEKNIPMNALLIDEESFIAPEEFPQGGSSVVKKSLCIDDFF